MNFITNLIPKDGYRRPGYLITSLEYITIHNTGNPTSNALGERSWLTDITNKVQASFQMVIDQNNCIECVPTGFKFLFPNTTPCEVAWHAGDGGNGTGNRKSIGIEICESGDYAKTVQNAIQVVAKILFNMNRGTEIIKQHFDWSGKDCPRIFRHTNTWGKFIADIGTELNRLKSASVPTTPQIPTVKTESPNKLVIADWQRTMGQEAVKALGVAGLLNTPDSWLDKVDENTPNWLFFEMYRRMYDKLHKEIEDMRALLIK